MLPLLNGTSPIVRAVADIEIDAARFGLLVTFSQAVFVTSFNGGLPNMLKRTG
jgi:hypothetical protein